MRQSGWKRLWAAIVLAMTLIVTPAFAAEQTQDAQTDAQSAQTEVQDDAAAAEQENADPFTDPRVWAVLVVIFGAADVIYMKQKKKKEHR